MKIDVGMYVRGKYYSYRGKIGKIIKNYKGELEIAYKDGIVKTSVSSFIDDNYDINGKQYNVSYDIRDLIEVGDYVNGHEVIYKDNNTIQVDCGGWIEADSKGWLHYENYEEDIKSVLTKEQMKQYSYKVGEE